MEIQKSEDLMKRLISLTDKVNLLVSLLDILGETHPLVVQMLNDLVAERDAIDYEFKELCLDQTNTMNGTSLSS